MAVIRIKRRLVQTQGFTLYYAVLVGSLILVIGASMLNISIKELTLSATLKESELAFFAADAGTECALYWDLQGYPSTLNGNPVTLKVFPASADPNSFSSTGDITKVQCNGGALPNAPTLMPESSSNWNTDWATTTFAYNVGPSGSYCAWVQVVKHENVDKSISTVINAKGYNLPGSGSDPVTYCDNNTSTRKVERGFSTSY